MMKNNNIESSCCSGGSSAPKPPKPVKEKKEKIKKEKKPKKGEEGPAGTAPDAKDKDSKASGKDKEKDAAKVAKPAPFQVILIQMFFHIFDPLYPQLIQTHWHQRTINSFPNWIRTKNKFAMDLLNECLEGIDTIKTKRSGSYAFHVYWSYWTGEVVCGVMKSSDLLFFIICHNTFSLAFNCIKTNKHDSECLKNLSVRIFNEFPVSFFSL